MTGVQTCALPISFFLFSLLSVSLFLLSSLCHYSVFTSSPPPDCIPSSIISSFSSSICLAQPAPHYSTDPPSASRGNQGAPHIHVPKVFYITYYTHRHCRNQTLYLQNGNFTGEGKKTFITFNGSQRKQLLILRHFGTFLLVHLS